MLSLKSITKIIIISSCNFIIYSVYGLRTNTEMDASPRSANSGFNKSLTNGPQILLQDFQREFINDLLTSGKIHTDMNIFAVQ